jgi:Protein of unknown function DUF72
MIVGVYEKKRLHFAAKVRNGFVPRMRDEILPSQEADHRRLPLRESPRKKGLALERDADCRKDEGVLVGRAGAGLSNGVRRMDGRRQASALRLCWDVGRKGGGEGCSGDLNRMPAPAPKPLLTREERRAKREAGRAKQREENVGRAAKMHTARLVWERSARPQASATATPSKAQVHVGCSGWFYWHWRGDFYPAELPTKDWFRHYSQQFGTVELNAPFYSWPTVDAVRVWLRQIERRKFVYTV